MPVLQCPQSFFGRADGTRTLWNSARVLRLLRTEGRRLGHLARHTIPGRLAEQFSGTRQAEVLGHAQPNGSAAPGGYWLIGRM